MYGYPRRQNKQRRVLPTTALFDPSGDSYCTGWWRADSGVQYSDTQKQLATGWTSKLPSAIVMTRSPATQWLVAPALTNGFPGICGGNSEAWSASGVAQDGDRSFTITMVVRVPRFYDRGQWLFSMDNMSGWGLWDGGGLRFIHPYVSWWDIQTTQPNIIGPTSVTVGTMRMRPYDEAGGDLRGTWRMAVNTSFIGGATQDSGWGDRILNPTHGLNIFGYSAAQVFWHEVVCFRRYLNDTEVLDMHTTLLAQYGVV